MHDPFLAHHIPTVGRRLSSSLVRAVVAALPTATATHAATSLANSTSLSSKPCGPKITGSPRWRCDRVRRMPASALIMTD
jgi:hypothetical protein